MHKKSKLLLAFVIPAILLTACKGKDGKDSDSVKLAGNDSSLNISEITDTVGVSMDEFYAHYKGTLGEKSCEADIFSRDKSIVIVYYTDGSTGTMTLTGKVNAAGDLITESIASTVKSPTSFFGTFKDKKINGLIKESGKETTLTLAEDYTESMSFKAFHYTKEEKLDNSSYSNIYTFYMANNHAIADSICMHFFDNSKTCTASPNTMMKSEDDEFYALYKSSITEDGFGNEWMRNKTSDITFNDNNLLCYAIHWDEYSGGAHGNYASSFYVYDIKTNKRLFLKDILINPNDAFWSDKIFKSILDEKGITEEELRGEVEVPILPNENIYINKGGIGFLYNAYELGSYAFGSSYVYFSLTPEVEKRIKPEILKRLK